jgi:hypothetical protein
MVMMVAVAELLVLLLQLVGGKGWLDVTTAEEACKWLKVAETNLSASAVHSQEQRC